MRATIPLLGARCLRSRAFRLGCSHIGRSGGPGQPVLALPGVMSDARSWWLTKSSLLGRCEVTALLSSSPATKAGRRFCFPLTHTRFPSSLYCFTSPDYAKLCCWRVRRLVSLTTPFVESWDLSIASIASKAERHMLVAWKY